MNEKKDTILFENLQFDNNYSINASWGNSPTSFPLHWHTFGEIALAATDHVILGISEQLYTLQTGDILFIWPGELHHTAHTEGPESHLIVQFSNRHLSGSAELSMLQNRILSEHLITREAAPALAEAIGGHMTDIKNAFFSRRDLNNLRMSISLQQILLLLYDHCTGSSAGRSIPGSSDQLRSIQAVTKACCYMTENCEKDLSLLAVAEHVGISKYHFSRLFHEHTGSSFSDYLAMQRIKKAILLFEDPNISIAEAAFQSGFGSIASFNRCFRKYKNCTPSDYRTMLQQG